MFKIKTIGHSNYDIEYFVNMLKENNIDTIADIRSTPYSRFNPQFNKDELNYVLKKQGLTYVFLGKELGARYEDKSLLFLDGKVDFKKVQATKSFLFGIERLISGLKKGYKISLMCSEKNPIECHRFGLVSEYLSKNGFDVSHITPSGEISQSNLELELMEKYKLGGLFANSEDYLDKAYLLLNKDIAYNAKTKLGDDE